MPIPQAVALIEIKKTIAQSGLNQAQLFAAQRHTKTGVAVRGACFAG